MTMPSDSNEDKLLFAVSLIRHGDRAPFARLDGITVDDYWPNGIGELTPEGMHQEYQLGKKLRKRYIETYQLLSSEYKQNSIYALSTPFTRTIMSAHCCLTGLYPHGSGCRLRNGDFALPDGYQPIPVFTIGAGEKNIINPESSGIDHFRRLINEESMNQLSWIDKGKELASDFKKWGQILGLQINSVYDMMLPGDTIFCMSQNGLPMPNGLTKEDIEKIIEIYLYICFTRISPEVFKKFMAEGFISKLNTDFQDAAEGRQKYKYLLYSGHDISIVAMMNALGAPLNENPPYASHLDFELYQSNTDYTVKIFYNGEVLEFPKGSGKTSYLLKEFQEFISPFLLEK